MKKTRNILLILNILFLILNIIIFVINGKPLSILAAGISAITIVSLLFI